MDDPISKYFPEWKTSKKVIKDSNGKEQVVDTDHSHFSKGCHDNGLRTSLLHAIHER